MLKGNVIVAITNPILAGSNGNYCRAVAGGGAPAAMAQSGIQYGVTGNQTLVDGSFDLFDSGSFKIQTGAGVTAGSVSVALLTLSPSGALNWITATTPNSTTGAAFTLVPTLGASATYNGSLNIAGVIFFPCAGIGLVVAGLLGGSITLMELNLTKR